MSKFLWGQPKGTYVYFITYEDEAITKIGISKDPFRRRDALQSANPKQLTLHVFFGPLSREGAMSIEKDIHQRLAKRRIRGEWFDVDYRVCWQFFCTKEMSYFEGCES